MSELQWIPPVLALLALTALIYFGMRRGWLRRARTFDPGPLPAAAGAKPAATAVAGTYVSTTTSGAKLERVTSHSLGQRSAALISVDAGGILIERQGAEDLFIPSRCLRSVDRRGAIIGKVVDREGLVVFTWDWNGSAVDTAVRPRYQSERAPLAAAASALLELQPSSGPVDHNQGASS